MTNDLSADLVARWRDRQDQQAADELVRRYVDRLIGLARRHLSAKVARRVDPEDAVQSAYRSFFGRIRDGRLDFQAGDNLWRLLGKITVCKVLRQVEYHTAAKRSIHDEQSVGPKNGQPGIQSEKLAGEPSPDEAVMLVDVLEQVMRELPSTHRRIIELRLQGQGDEQIAQSVGRSERTVRRVLEQVEEKLKRRQLPVGPPARRGRQ